MGFKETFNRLAAEGAAIERERARAPKPKKQQVKTVTLNITRKKDAKKLADLTADGWHVLSEHRRSVWISKGGQVDYVLTKDA